MKQFIDKLISRIDRLIVLSLDKWDGGASENAYKICKDIIQEEVTQYNNGWIPCEKELPPQPKENPLFENKPLELYMVSNNAEYPFRAFWNGRFFTDGFGEVDAIAWQPLPPKFEPKGE